MTPKRFFFWLLITTEPFPEKKLTHGVVRCPTNEKIINK